MNKLLTVSLRQKAIFIPDTEIKETSKTLTEPNALLVANLAELGFGVAEPLLQTLNGTTSAYQATIITTLRKVMGMDKNWTPLVKGWDTLTGESWSDHLITFFANLFKTKGTKLPCGHSIPQGTFPLHRYNGCPFCGTPFLFGSIEQYKQGNEEKVLDLWTLTDAATFLEDLLMSKTALDATQIDSLKILLSVFPLPDVKIGVKETLMVVINTFISQEAPEKAQSLFTSPTDILRYLWYKHTGFVQIIEPKTILSRSAKNANPVMPLPDIMQVTKLANKGALKLKYNRKDCLMVATWLNSLEQGVTVLCEIMHPKRGMWVRFIRALRLAEYSKRPGFEKLSNLLDKFYKQEYTVWQAQVNQYRLRYDAEQTFKLLQQRPGLFARSLFANMLWFGSKRAIEAFAAIIDKVPARLVFTLYMYADNYFDKSNNRTVKPLGGISKNIPANYLLRFYSEQQLEEMCVAIADLCILTVKKRFAALESNSKTMYIDPALFTWPVSIGDRSDTLQDLPAALMGTRFPVDGNSIRLFMQWGKGLPAQHLDMDLSCIISYDERTDRCSFNSLAPVGCKHSGDIINIPDNIGTAEYIELDLAVLKAAGARYITFTCNAYSSGSISPNLVIGWMNSQYPMRISQNTGVAYDPSCVQHQVRVVNGLNKGLVFGVLEVEKAEIVWLELPFAGQLAQNLDTRNITAMLKKLSAKLTIGELLLVKAEAQNLQLIETPEADEAYTQAWALNTAAVTKLLVDG
jgi:hypothetical protein